MLNLFEFKTVVCNRVQFYMKFCLKDFRNKKNINGWAMQPSQVFGKNGISRKPIIINVLVSQCA